MKITKTLNDPDAKPFEIDKEIAVEYLEERGYYEQGTVDKVMHAALKTTLRTPWAFYHFDPCN